MATMVTNFFQSRVILNTKWIEKFICIYRIQSFMKSHEVIDATDNHKANISVSICETYFALFLPCLVYQAFLQPLLITETKQSKAKSLHIDSTDCFSTKAFAQILELCPMLESTVWDLAWDPMLSTG